jgi:hypothetical protein
MSGLMKSKPAFLVWVYVGVSIARVHLTVVSRAEPKATSYKCMGYTPNQLNSGWTG